MRGIKTRIGLGYLARDGLGSVELPENVTWCCPQCGTPVADKGQCLARFMEWPESQADDAPNVVKIIVDCRTCGCQGREPMEQETWDFLHPDCA